MAQMVINSEEEAPEFSLKCVYCEGMGIAPRPLRPGRCVVCGGAGKNKFTGDPSKYMRCGRCRGTGVIHIYTSINAPPPSPTPCPLCGGKGILP